MTAKQEVPQATCGQCSEKFPRTDTLNMNPFTFLPVCDRCKIVWESDDKNPPLVLYVHLG